MKKAVSILLVLVLCLGLYACKASKEEVKNTIIQNSWVGTNRGAEFTVTFLNDNNAWIKCVYSTGFEYTWEGAFEITKDQIVVSDTLNKIDIFIDYTMKGDTISLTLYDPVSQDAVTLAKGYKGLF